MHPRGGGGAPLSAAPHVEGAAVAGVGELGLQQVSQALRGREALQCQGGGGLQGPDPPQAFGREGTQSRGRNVPARRPNTCSCPYTHGTDCTQRMISWRIIYSHLCLKLLKRVDGAQVTPTGRAVTRVPLSVSDTRECGISSSECLLTHQPCCLFTQTGCQRLDKETINFVTNINRASLTQFKCGCLTCFNNSR